MLHTRENRRARGAVAALFLTNGALFANMAPRLPEFKAQLGLEAGAYGLLVTAWPVGAIVAGLAAGSLIRRFGSAAVAVFGTLATGLAVLGAGSAGSLALVAAAFVVGGAMDAITDVAQNAHGLEVQRRYGRPILNSFHALWSVGAVLGGLMAAGAMALGLPLAAHFAISWLLFAAVALTAWKFCLPARGPVEPVEEHSVAAEPVPAASWARITVVIAALVLIASAGIMVEDAGNSWATLYLGSLGAPSALAASGYIALVGAQFIGRILGDSMVHRFGQRLIAQLGAVLVAGGMGLALAFPSIPGSLLGFAAAGFGVATLVPAAMEQADRIPGLAPGTGLSIVSWLMRLGFLLSPPLVGFIAQNFSLRAGLLVVPIAGLIVLLCSPVLRARRPAGR
ncbi:cyanate permease [Arthrobacter sp. AG1021]|uniref:MFS transporter n=1 Tax=Arthrobacter sp. AG1021 TaxID=2183908 RepID=UPI000EAD9574|nr:MFS transporter [Arthrobacter sp. AG1021]RKS18366.1 cyanate permease [Arthrobacter sp. AG1021]